MVWWVTWEVRQFSVVGVQRLIPIAMYVCVYVPKNTVLIHYNRCTYVAM